MARSVSNEDNNPCDLKEAIQFTNEWAWNERRLETAIANRDEEEDVAMTDSSETVDGSAESE